MRINEENLCKSLSNTHEKDHIGGGGGGKLSALSASDMSLYNEYR